MDNLARLSERRRVHVFDSPRQGGRGAVVLAIDDVSYAADGKADHRRGSAGVDDLPVGDSRPAGPDVGANHGSEQAAPLADPALRDRKHPKELSTRVKPEVFPHIKKT